MKTGGQGHRGQKCDTQRQRTGTAAVQGWCHGGKTNGDRSFSWMSDIYLFGDPEQNDFPRQESTPT